MILRYDCLGIEIPVGDPDPAGAMLVQDLMGGRFGEMSTFINYAQQDVFAPDEIAEIARKLRREAGFTDDTRMRAA